MPSKPTQLTLKEAPPYETPTIERQLDEIELLARDAALLHQAIRDAVEEVGPKDSAWAMKRDGSTLSNWINERPDAQGNPRMPPAKLLLFLGKRQKSGRLTALLARLWGFAPPVRAVELTPEEENRRLRAELQAAGTVGQHILERALGSGR
jgi:hypothetical protein